MAYFPNGTSGEIFQDRWCRKCRHFRDRKEDEYPLSGQDGEECCPIWDAHLLSSAGYGWRGDNPDEAGAMVCSILDLLIDDEAQTCWMFEGLKDPGPVLPFDD